MTQTIITDDNELRVLAQVDVFYEVDTLCHWYSMEIPKSAEANRLRKARTEIGLLHLRSLAHFLRDDRPPDDHKRMNHLDVVADHFFIDARGHHDWDRPLHRPMFTRSGDDQYLKKQIDRHLAHITRDRYLQRGRDGEAFSWDDVDPSLVLQEFERFVDELRRIGRPDRAGWHRNSIAAIRQLRNHARNAETIELFTSTNG